MLVAGVLGRKQEKIQVWELEVGKEHFAISNKYRSPLNNAWVRGLITPQPLTSLSTFPCPAVGNPCLTFNSAVIPSHTQSHTRWMENNIFHPHWENLEVLFSICGCLNLLMQNSWLWRTDYIFWKTSSVSGPVKFKPMLLKSQLYKVSLVREHLIANSKMLYNIRFIALQTTKTEKALTRSSLPRFAASCTLESWCGPAPRGDTTQGSKTHQSCCQTAMFNAETFCNGTSQYAGQSKGQ